MIDLATASALDVNLADKNLDVLYAEARFHREQAEAHFEQAKAHWLELARRSLEIKARVSLGAFVSTVKDEAGCSPRIAQHAMYVGRNAKRVSYLPPTAGLQQLVEVVREGKRNHRQETCPLPDVALPPELVIEQADAADLPMGNGLADLIVTSPPYGLGLEIDSTDGYPAYLEAAAV
jgi:hypothetical protein